ncbi:hypothetical protein EV421DRAFT_886588 [Armillaria borealis]|uniref:MYND-type domain-containing protein n=1 Tax=Armillaria borealis TaxID=47425 RepID=A0AA39K314_9AGAR|nr:hypothetical protein EV421DRAFT_886588 [Armillaria borealis]
MNSAGNTVLQYRLPGEDETWYTLCEIVEDISMFVRPVYKVEDKLPGNYWSVAIYTDDPVQDAEDLKCEIGSTMCIKNSRLHRFFDGQIGYRIEDLSTVTVRSRVKKSSYLLTMLPYKVLPCTIAQLRTLNSWLRQRSDAGQFMSCIVCNEPAQHRCTRCKSRYCSQKCQRQDWKEHKVTCKALKTLLEWNIVFA